MSRLNSSHGLCARYQREYILIPENESELDVTTSSEAVRTWRGSHWEVELKGLTLDIKKECITETFSCDESVNIEAKRRWFRWYLYNHGESIVRLSGASKIESKLIEVCFELSRTRIWSEKVQATLENHRKNGRWISQETIDELVESKPIFRKQNSLARFGLINSLSKEEQQALVDLNSDLGTVISQINSEILKDELISQRDFLENIEAKPLSDEQAAAVLTFDNRVLLVASAGSGKTSVMVARAAYAIKRDFIHPSRVLLLAFNKAAADELQMRIEARFEKANIKSDGIVSSTFHAFGLDIIGKGTNAKPGLAPWVEKGRDSEEIADIVKELKETSEDFRYKWDLFRLIFPPETLKISGVEFDAWDSESEEQGFRTFDGKVVRSHGERMIANWLYLHGVTYQYERDFDVNTSNAFRRQYKPDFYYPEIDVWHEHWALDKQGNPPPEFKDYLAGIDWKRSLHTKHKTKLIETSFGEVVYGSGLPRLKEELSRLGLKLNWDPNRPKAPYTNVEDSEAIRLIRTFMTHIKSNSLTSEDIYARLNGEWGDLQNERTSLFLEIFWAIYDAWNRRLRAGNLIDFEDMLIRASEILENQVFTPDFDLILVDEFQDSSSARARLIKSMLGMKGKYVLVVGDDWQSVNRFAGADVSQMTKFHDSFGNGPTLHLSRTYRCTQVIANVATEFVTKNPSQMKKQVHSVQESEGSPVILLRSSTEHQGVLEAFNRINTELEKDGQEEASVFVLGRYNHNRDWIPPEEFPNLKVTYKTVHGSKGLEADYVVVVNLESGRHGFPSEIEDDPLLNLAMSEPELYEHAEERRLLYVALTRARKQAFLVTKKNRDSIFAVELMADPGVNVVTIDGGVQIEGAVPTCPKCNQGIMVQKSGKFGPFLGCSRFPKCVNTTKIGRKQP